MQCTQRKDINPVHLPSERTKWLKRVSPYPALIKSPLRGIWCFGKKEIKIAEK